jgi:hypothetical protein
VKLCRNGLHEMTEANTVIAKRYGGAGGGYARRCRACINTRTRASKQLVGDNRHQHRPSHDTADDFLFLFTTGLSPRAIAAKLDMHDPSMLAALKRAGVPIVYDQKTQTWSLK